MTKSKQLTEECKELQQLIKGPYDELLVKCEEEMELLKTEHQQQMHIRNNSTRMS